MKTKKNKSNHESRVVDSELILQIKRVNKTHPKNETYDYMIAKYFNESKGNTPCDGITVLDIENFIGMRISDVAMCNKLLFYWIAFCGKNERVMKARNIIELIERPTERLIKSNEEMIKKQKLFFNQLFNLKSTINGNN